MEREELLRKIDDINLQFQRELDLIFKTPAPDEIGGRLTDVPADRPATVGELKNSVMILWNNTVQMVKTLLHG